MNTAGRPRRTSTYPGLEPGTKHYRLTVVGPGSSKSRLSCLCECGTSVDVRIVAIRTNHQKSCGCLRAEGGSDIRIGADSILYKHGYSRTMPEYKVWTAMLQRCHNPNNAFYPEYGGRGIFVCDSWRTSFVDFINSIGRRPPGDYSIGRIDNDRGYSHENVRWETRRQQQNNRRVSKYITMDGVTKTLTEWSRDLDLSTGAILGRLRRNWSIKDALTRPTSHRGRPRRSRS